MNTDPKKWYVIVNPLSGGGRARRIWQRASVLMDKKELLYEAGFTTHPRHAIELTQQAIENGYRRLLVLGGDGTLNEVVNGIFNQQTIATEEIAVAKMGVGTGDDWIRTMGISPDHERVVEYLEAIQTKIIDAGKVTYMQNGETKTRYFVNVAGMLLDAAITARANRNRWIPGKLAYYWALVSTALFFKKKPLTLTVDGRHHEMTAFNLNVGNCQYAGGGLCVAPDAVPDDGMLDVTVVGDVTKWEVLQTFPKIKSGKFVFHPKVHQFKGKTIHIESPHPLPIEVEGEELGHSPITIELIPRAIKVVMP